MDKLPMPSDLKRAEGPAPAPVEPPAPAPQEAAGIQATVEPPSARLIVRLFLIPLLIVLAAVGVMMVIGLLAAPSSSKEDALRRLRQPGGERTGPWLVGPGAKQRYMDAKTLTDHMKAGMTEAERIELTGELVEILDRHTQPHEGHVQHFLLLALGRNWQIDPSQPPMDSPEAKAARQRAMGTLLRYADAQHVETRKAAVLAIVYWAGRDEVAQAMPRLIAALQNEAEDLDVRISAATVLGPLSTPEDQRVIDALNQTMRRAFDDPRNVELGWSSALSLAQLNRPESVGTILMLLDRDELAQLRYYDRETDPRNPRLRDLNDQEQQRILINTMIGARHLDDERVQNRLRELAESDPSPRVRAAGIELLRGAENPISGPR